ncbi:interaptin isoform X1 [Eurytemora carolleeae]|uniref:interaptin isoform X1 n=1 Tax=Eurytemora carolleeae TaxID=1294199 RepID=UPI000C757AD0|nr:interaptin isoform X1 [Eurytemora carolleeae]|eukprot:XP_023324755.1 interaptin-like isoform X1 [Eurytemora affinis]
MSWLGLRMFISLLVACFTFLQFSEAFTSMATNDAENTRFSETTINKRANVKLIFFKNLMRDLDESGKLDKIKQIHSRQQANQIEGQPKVQRSSSDWSEKKLKAEKEANEELNDEYRLDEEKELIQQLKQEKKLKEKNTSETPENVVQQLKEELMKLVFTSIIAK